MTEDYAIEQALISAKIGREPDSDYSNEDFIEWGWRSNPEGDIWVWHPLHVEAAIRWNSEYPKWNCEYPTTDSFKCYTFDTFADLLAALEGELGRKLARSANSKAAGLF